MRDTVQLILPLLSVTDNKPIRRDIATLLPSLLECAKCANLSNETDKESIIQMARILIDSLSVAIVGEYEAEILVEELSSMKAIIDLINTEFLSE